MGHGFNLNFNQKAFDKTKTPEAKKKREEAKAFGDKVMGRTKKIKESGVKGMDSKIPSSKVGNCKGGHGNFCGQSKLNRKEGNKKGGEGLARV